MPLPVFDARAALSDEWLVVSGGFSAELTTTPAIQVYHMTRGWRPIGTQLADARAHHTQTTLLDGRILVVGGIQGSLSSDAEAEPVALATAELFHPLIAGTESIELGEPLAGHSAHRLDDGRVAVVGGRWVRVFDPDCGAFTQAIRLRSPRRRLTAVLWRRFVYPPDFDVESADDSGSFAIVDQELSIDMVPTARGASIGATMEPQRVPVPTSPDRSALPTRTVLLIIGGDADGTIEEVDLEGGQSRMWNARLPLPLLDASAAALSDGRVLIIGGIDGRSDASIEATWVVDSRETLEPGPALEFPLGITGATAFVDPMDGSVVVFGGEWHDAASIEPIGSGRMIRSSGSRIFNLPMPSTCNRYARRSWIRLDERRVAAVGGYRFVDIPVAATEGIAPGVYVRGEIDVVRMPSPIGGD